MLLLLVVVLGDGGAAAEHHHHQQEHQQQHSASSLAGLGLDGEEEEGRSRTPSFEVVEVPSYEQLLEWAREKDRQVADRKIYGLGGVLAEVRWGSSSRACERGVDDEDDEPIDDGGADAAAAGISRGGAEASGR